MVRLGVITLDGTIPKRVTTTLRAKCFGKNYKV